ncbi:MAG: acyl-CoA mutase large subunit family protein [Caldisericia bacterium]
MNEEKKKFITTSEIEIKELYLPQDDFDYTEKLGKPGEYPFTRGVYPNMYRGRLWTMRQYAGFGTSKETNLRYKYLLSQGQTGLSVAFDLPTQIGYDSDDEIAQSEVGKVGVSISTIDDMDELFDSIPLNEISTSMTINSTATILLAMYVAVAEKRGIDRKILRGTVQNDILKEYIARGTYIFPPEPSLRLSGDLIEWCAKEIPKWNGISISGYHIREAGSNAVQEVAFTLLDAIEYVKLLLDRGLDVDFFAKGLSFFFASHNNFFEEIAKFRALRRMWAKIMKEKFNAKNPESMMLKFHTQTGGVTLTSIEPMNNIIRVTLQALAAVLGGTQSLHTNSFDEALSLPSEESVRIALRTQQIIAYESGVIDTVDPVGGSYFIEQLTDEIEKKAFEIIERIENMGGMKKAILLGIPQKEILESSYKYQKEVEEQERVIVGKNKFRIDEEKEIKRFKVSEKILKERIEKLENFRKNRDFNETSTSLRTLKEKAKTEENLMPYILDSVKKKATLGEIVKELKEVFGEYDVSITL